MSVNYEIDQGKSRGGVGWISKGKNLLSWGYCYWKEICFQGSKIFGLHIKVTNQLWDQKKSLNSGKKIHRIGKWSGNPQGLTSFSSSSTCQKRHVLGIKVYECFSMFSPIFFKGRQHV